MAPSTPPPLFTVRTALVLLLGLVCGALAAGLSLLAHTAPAEAVLIALGVMGGAIAFFHKNIG